MPAAPLIDQHRHRELLRLLRFGLRFHFRLGLGALLLQIDAHRDVAGDAWAAARGLNGELAIGAERLTVAAAVLELELDDEADLAGFRDADDPNRSLSSNWLTSRRPLRYSSCLS